MSDQQFDEQVFEESEYAGLRNSVNNSINQQEFKSKYPQSFSKYQSDQQQNPDICSLLYSKNKYQQKIKNLKPDKAIQASLKKNEEQYSLKNEQSVQNERHSTKKLDKKQRNKQAAKNSRDRKKMYIQILQQKKRQKQKRLSSKKKQLQEAKQYYEKLVNQNRTMSNFAASRHQLIKKLENLLDQNSKILTNNQGSIFIDEQQNAINSQINQIIDSLRSRIGATGKQRINTINQYFQQIINLSLPALHRYLMWSASEHKHLFSQNQQLEAQNQQWFKELKTALNLTQQQKRQIHNKQQFLQQQKKVLQNLIEQLKKVKDDIESKSLQLDDLIDEIRKILTPIQCASFILFIQRNKYRKQLNLCDISYANQGQYQRKMRKLVKKDPLI